ncbi:MAG: biosis protein MshQ [Moraxellaceae bacterium]|jgi:hypothetical protein|nr:biosis protein MshQ [Moraxellaceae bacterium]
MMKTALRCLLPILGLLMLAGPVWSGDGLLGAYYDQGGSSGAFFTGTAVTRVDATVAFGWGNGTPGAGATPANHFSVRWTGDLEITTAGGHKFQTIADDGVRLYVDLNRNGSFADAGELLINSWTDKSAATTSATGGYTLAVGRYPIQLEYYERTGSASVQLLWDTPGRGKFLTIPQANLWSNAKVTGFSITPGATSCLGQELVISATDPLGRVVTTYQGTVQISTSTGRGNWSRVAANGVLNPTPDTDNNGAVSYTFAATDNGAATLRLANASGGSLTVALRDTTLGVTSTSGSLSYASTYFVITTPDPLGSDVVAGRPHQVRVELWSSAGGSGCGVMNTYTGSRNLKAWLTRDVQDPGGAAPTLGGTSLPIAAPAANNLSGNFTSGVLTLTLGSTDVGKYSLNLRDDSLGFSSAPINGSSSVLVARPFGLALDFGGDRLANGATGTSTATTASGPLFARAGSAFSTTISAVRWQAADDANGDGLPDSGASLYDNALTASFGAEPTPAQVSLGATLVQPVGGTLGTLDNAAGLGGFSGGAVTVTPDYSEVGIITLHARLDGGSYLGSGRTLAGTAANLGRFAPDHFRITASALTPFCSAATPFTYMGQAFGVSYTLVAEDASDSPTLNYSGSFARLNLASAAALRFRAVNLGTTPIVLTSRLGASALTGSWSNGVSSAATAQLTLGRASSPDGSFSIFATGLAPIDGDGTVLAADTLDLDTDGDTVNDAVGLGAQSLRYGRLAVDNTAGSELLALAVPVRLEYWKPIGASGNGGFFSNTDDSCTTLSATPAGPPAWGSFTLGGYTNNLQAGETMVSAWTGFSSGAGRLTLSAPGNGNDGALTFTVSGPAWLRYDYNKSVPGDENAVGRASFGLYRGKTPVIFWRETFR